MRRIVLLAGRAFLLIGLTGPSLYIAISMNYASVFNMLFQSVLAFDRYWFFSLIGLAAVLLFAFRWLLGRTEAYQALLVICATIPIAVPSLILLATPVSLLVSPSLGPSVTMSPSVRDLYLAGLSIEFVTIPLILTILQSEMVLKRTGDVATPVVLSVMAFSFFALLGLAVNSEMSLETGRLPLLGLRVLHYFALLAGGMFSSLLSFELYETADTLPQIRAGNELLWIGAVFTVATAVYFYHRLYKPDGEAADRTHRPMGSMRPSVTGFTILIAVLLTFLMIQITQRIDVLQYSATTVLLLAVMMLVFFTIPTTRKGNVV